MKAKVGLLKDMGTIFGKSTMVNVGACVGLGIGASIIKDACTDGEMDVQGDIGTGLKIGLIGTLVTATLDVIIQSGELKERYDQRKLNDELIDNSVEVQIEEA